MAPVTPAPTSTRTIGTWPVSRVFLLISGVCMTIAALLAAGVFSGPVLGWALGSVAAYIFAWAI